MGHFHASGKRYAEGTDFPAFGNNEGDWNPNGSEDLTAPALLPDTGGNRPFLFWDTGRRVTTKRRVIWTFHHGDQWTTWNATAWYGPPVGGNGVNPQVSVNAFWVGQGLMDPTPIDGPNSTFHNGPGAGQVAWPFNGDNHIVRTEWGSATIRALDHLQRTPTDPLLDFSTLSQLVSGGDDSGFCEENDDDVTTSSGVTGIAGLGSQSVTFAQNSGAILLAGYVTPAPVTFRPPGEREYEWWKKYFDRGDPAAFRQLGEALVDIASRVDEASRQVPDVFANLAAQADKMSSVQLTLALAEARSVLNRGEATVKALEARAAEQTRNQ
jgi:hypothetical protein